MIEKIKDVKPKWKQAKFKCNASAIVPHVVWQAPNIQSQDLQI